MPTTFQRQPLAVMFTDIKGYTSLTSKDEMLALSLVDKKRSILQPLLKKHKGTFVKEMGDGTVTYFKDPAQATDCAIKLQEQTHDDENLNIRIGIHYGDAIIKNKDVFGDTVNIASRIESLGIPGGVLISKEARDQIKEPHDDVSLGLQTMKGVGRLIEVYGLKGKGLSTPNPKNYEGTKIRAHSDKDVPSIAILPFENKGKEEDEFYSHGIISDLITDVSSAGRIRVASLKDIEKLEYNILDNTKLAQQLFVRYIAQGSLWKKGDTFQLSVELYDTKKEKVLWADNWQENWEELPAIKINLSNGLLKALDTKSKYQNKVDSHNVEAYEYYLRAKHRYEKRENTEDIEIARGLLNKTIELDENLMIAKSLLGATYSDKGEYKKAMEIFIPTLKQAEEINNKRGILATLNAIGMVFYSTGNNDKALDYYSRTIKIINEIGDKHALGICLQNMGLVYGRKGNLEKTLNYYESALAIFEELDDKQLMGYALGNIGGYYINKGEYNKALDYFFRCLKIFKEFGDKDDLGNCYNCIGVIYVNKGDYDTALEYYTCSLKILEEIDNKDKIGGSLGNIGVIYSSKGDYVRALDYYNRSLKICEEIGSKFGMGYVLANIGDVYISREEYGRAVEILKKALNIQKEIGLEEGDLNVNTITSLYFAYKKLSKNFDLNKLRNLVENNKKVEFKANYHLFKLLGKSSYLEIAYNQVMEMVNALEKNLKTKYLNYPIPKTIIKEYEKLKK